MTGGYSRPKAIICSSILQKTTDFSYFLFGNYGIVRNLNDNGKLKSLYNK